MLNFLSPNQASRILCLILLFLHQSLSNNCTFNVKLKQTLHNEGFHRNLTYDIKFGEHNGEGRRFEGCSVGLEQVLPTGVYASPDETDTKYKTTTVFKSKVNIELPAEEASPITVHLLGSVRNDRTYMFLPVHARYHSALPGGGSAKVVIPQPQLYINCGRNKLDDCSSTPRDVSVVNSFCPKASQKCPWKEVPITVSEQLVWFVPQGNTDHHNLVMFGTASVVAFGSLYLLKGIHRFKRRWQRKCNKDR